MRWVKKFFSGFALLSIELIIILIVFIIALIAFIFITNEIFRLKDTNFDTSVFAMIHPYITNTLTRIMRLVTYFATPNFLVPANVLLCLFFLLVTKHNWYSLKIPVVSLGSLIVMSSLKLYFSRPRPSNPVYQAARGFSYPSGHAMLAMTFYGILIYLVWKNIRQKGLRLVLTVLLLIIILLIGFSRVYLRVHFASDVLAGYCMGLMWLVVSLWTIQKIETYTKKKIAPVVEEKKL
jgi:membrane-associated phospholipid phosphatase